MQPLSAIKFTLMCRLCSCLSDPDPPPITAVSSPGRIAPDTGRTVVMVFFPRKGVRLNAKVAKIRVYASLQKSEYMGCLTTSISPGHDSTAWLGVAVLFSMRLTAEAPCCGGFIINRDRPPRPLTRATHELSDCDDSATSSSSYKLRDILHFACSIF